MIISLQIKFQTQEHATEYLYYPLQSAFLESNSDISNFFSLKRTK